MGFHFYVASGILIVFDVIFLDWEGQGSIQTTPFIRVNLSSGNGNVKITSERQKE